MQPLASFGSALSQFRQCRLDKGRQDALLRAFDLGWYRGLLRPRFCDFLALRMVDTDLAPAGEFLDRPARLQRSRFLLQNVGIVDSTGGLVVGFEQQPLLVLLSRLATRPDEVPLALKAARLQG
jgi:hypothetical protein